MVISIYTGQIRGRELELIEEITPDQRDQETEGKIDPPPTLPSSIH